MKRKFLAMALMASMVFSLSACGNSGGGLLDASVKIVSMFVRNGMVVETKGF